MDEAFDAICVNGYPLAQIHGLRTLRRVTIERYHVFQLRLRYTQFKTGLGNQRKILLIHHGVSEQLPVELKWHKASQRWIPREFERESLSILGEVSQLFCDC